MLTYNERKGDKEIHFSIDNINTVNKSETWYKDLFIDKVRLAFKIDTGANIN